MTPPAPWTAKGNRVYAADGEEIAVATKASPRWRATADETATLIADASRLESRCAEAEATIAEQHAALGDYEARVAKLEVLLERLLGGAR
jgi:hypothetical protein